jgi:hypothetical protein
MADLNVKQTKTIRALYSELPITGTAMQYLVQVTEPIEMVPVIKTVSQQFGDRDIPTMTETLKANLLLEWKASVKNIKESWVHAVNEVNLIECDLLVPKPVKPCAIIKENK